MQLFRLLKRFPGCSSLLKLYKWRPVALLELYKWRPVALLELYKWRSVASGGAPGGNRVSLGGVIARFLFYKR